MTYQASDRKQVRALEKLQNEWERSRHEVIVQLMSTTAGRAWVFYFLNQAKVFGTVFSSDPILMAFSEGNRNQGLILLGQIMAAAPDNYILMMREEDARSSAAANAAKSDAAPDGSDPADSTDGSADSADA